MRSRAALNAHHPYLWFFSASSDKDPVKLFFRDVGSAITSIRFGNKDVWPSEHSLKICARVLNAPASISPRNAKRRFVKSENQPFFYCKQTKLQAQHSQIFRSRLVETLVSTQNMEILELEN